LEYDGKQNVLSIGTLLHCIEHFQKWHEVPTAIATATSFEIQSGPHRLFGRHASFIFAKMLKQPFL
jgi:hypothetical protein